MTSIRTSGTGWQLLERKPARWANRLNQLRSLILSRKKAATKSNNIFLLMLQRQPAILVANAAAWLLQWCWLAIQAHRARTSGLFSTVEAFQCIMTGNSEMWSHHISFRPDSIDWYEQRQFIKEVECTLSSAIQSIPLEVFDFLILQSVVSVWLFHQWHKREGNH